MTLLELIQRATRELGLLAPNAVASSADLQVIQFHALINKVGESIITDARWQGITKTHRFTTVVIEETANMTSGSAILTAIGDTSSMVADTFMVTGDNIPADTFVLSVDSGTQVTLTKNVTGTATASAIVATQTIYDLPSDYDYTLNRTHWDQTNHWEILGPRSPQEWQYLKSGIISTGPRTRYRLLDDKFQIWPPNISTYDFVFEYQSNAWVIPASGNEKTEFDMDDDTCEFRDRTMIDGVKLEFYGIKGFDTTKLQRDFDLQIDKEIAFDRPAPTLSLQSKGIHQFLNYGSVPESGFGS